MCGIAGLYRLTGNAEPPELLRRVREMTGAMVHRGPDGDGLWKSADHRCVLGHRRLSIVDLSDAGQQPMVSDAGQHALTFNGEVYNFKELRAVFERQGETFRSRTDTEVLLKGLMREGPYYLTRLDGMFALALYDVARGELLLARDAFGEKPLYYCEVDGYFAFASELSALTRLPGFDGTIEADDVARYLAFQMVPGARTIYARVRRLLPGHMLRVTARGVGDPHCFAPLDFHASEPSLAAPWPSIREAADELEAHLATAIERRLMADVPVGCFLSGGVDSSTTTAIAVRRLGTPVKTFSIGFKGEPYSEYAQALEMSQHLGTEHVALDMPARAYVDLLDTVATIDEPNLDSSCAPTWLVSQLARQHVTVALTGDGGDELFGGYGRYQECMFEASRRTFEIARREWHTGVDYSRRLMVFREPDLTALFGYVPSGLSDTALAYRRHIDASAAPLLHRLRAADTHFYLPVVLAKVDRMSMKHSLECRTPFFSPEVSAFARRLPTESLVANGYGKAVLREVASRYFPKEWIYREKRGFGMTPGQREVADGLLVRLRQRVASGICQLTAFMPADRLKAALDGSLAQSGFYHTWALLLLDLWLERNPWRAAA
jgi:asparagine synthase (glutamine-hydrolysing)